MPIVSVGRDPFARGEYLRQSEAQAETRAECHWCGNAPRTLYRYAWVEDGATRHRRLVWSAPYCNRNCHYAGQD
jgi:hypothetical protein